MRGGWLWLAAVLPLAAGGVLLILPERGWRKVAGPLAIAAAAAVAALSVWAWAARPASVLPWLPEGASGLALSLSAAAAAAPLACLVAVASLLVLVYSQGYLDADEDRTRFFGFMAVFVGGMELLVLADDLLTLLLGWELVGMCSYALIGFWHQDPVRIRAAQRAFVATRSADLGLYLAAMAAFAGQGGFAFATLGQLPAPWAAVAAAGIIAAAAGKSAQLPFSGWLSGAMQGPTPVSALLHSATMVAAGAVVLVKAMPLLETLDWALTLILWLGVATALVGGVVALYQSELKQLLAGSTISQYGYIFAALGAAGTGAALTHLVNHAAFKGLLFLCAGALVHQGMKHYREMGGLRRAMPITAVLFAVVILALTPLPPPGGFFSKEALLGAVKEASHGALGLLWAASFITAAYAGRAWFAAFAGQPRSAEAENARDPQSLLRWPMYVLGLAALLLGALALPPLKGWWTAQLDAKPLPRFSWLEAAVSLAIAGLAVAWIVHRYRRQQLVPFAPVVSARVAWAAEHWLGLVALLDGIGRGTAALGRALDRLDRTHPADLIAALVQRCGGALDRLDRARPAEFIGMAVLGFAGGLDRQERAWRVRAALASYLAAFDVRALSRGVVGGVVRGTWRAAGLTYRTDRRAIDGVLRGLTDSLGWSAAALTRIQTGLLHQYYLFMILGAGALLAYALTVLGG